MHQHLNIRASCLYYLTITQCWINLNWSERRRAWCSDVRWHCHRCEIITQSLMVGRSCLWWCSCWRCTQTLVFVFTNLPGSQQSHQCQRSNPSGSHPAGSCCRGETWRPEVTPKSSCSQSGPAQPRWPGRWRHSQESFWFCCSSGRAAWGRSDAEHELIHRFNLVSHEAELVLLQTELHEVHRRAEELLGDSGDKSSAVPSIQSLDMEVRSLSSIMELISAMLLRIITRYK